MSVASRRQPAMLAGYARNAGILMHSTTHRPAALFATLLLTLASSSAAARSSTAPEIGIDDRTPNVRAFVHARLVVSPGKIIADGSLLVEDGVIRAAGANLRIPDGAAVIDLAGKSIYPGFIDAWSDYGQAHRGKGKSTAGSDDAAESGARAGAGSWNPKVHPELRVAETARPDPKAAAKLRKLGFTDVLSAPAKGIWRGQSALLTTADAANLNAVLVQEGIAQHAALETSSWNASSYPGSLMGSIALFRQTLLDADWQQQRLAWQQDHPAAERVEPNVALDALGPVLAGRQSVFFATTDELDYARADELADEFDLGLVLLGNGHEYRRAEWLGRSGLPVVLPLKLPEAPKVEDPDKALSVSLADLEHWRMAPYNARILVARGVPIAFTAHDLEKPGKEFFANLHKMVESGLKPADALAALTTAPARILGVGDRLGSLEAGKLAHFLIADNELLRDKDARIYEVWIGGKRHEVNELGVPDPRGTWSLAWNGAQGPARIEISGDKKLTAKAGEEEFPLQQDGDRLLIYMPGKMLGGTAEHVIVNAELGAGSFEGRATTIDGARVSVRGTLEKAATEEPLEPWVQVPLPELDLARWPAGAHGRHGVPNQPEAVLVRNARIWTQGPKGILENADLLVKGGRIVAVGQDLSAPSGALEIDGSGKQVTPGIIDAHSHIAVSRGVNEGTHAVTSEVRIGDALDPTDIILYRQLAGGTTTAQVLHGSANPIGGQSQIIKLRWGADAESLKFRRAPPTIKFALGENVKQSNWGEDYTTRYPQTRMGVEQLIIDTFLAARDYGLAHKAGHADDGGPLRRNLQLEALWQILQGDRLVQIHSYRQDEILAFVRTAERFGFVPTFQHVLEGYKVADAMAKLGAGGSTFSDWWAYKFEVYDAIPWNGAIMANQGVTVSFNSDSDEMGRRLNTEAAKAIKYGDLSPEDALDFVTMNPARQLHIDQYVGSLEAGKDADFVIWSDKPLSPAAIPLETWVDGRKYFDREEDRTENRAIRERRERLIALALPERVKALAKDKDDDKEGKEAPEAARKVGTPNLFCAMLGQRDLYHGSRSAAECAEGELQ